MRTVLFVEDDPLVLTIYGSRLEREGFLVKSAENGQVAIEMLPQIRPDLVVLDLMLPKLPGLEVLKFIRADAHLKETPVVVLSNVYMAEMAHKAVQAGANKGMLKTECTPAKLVGAIRDLLGSDTGSESHPADNSPAESHVADAGAMPSEDASVERTRGELLREAPAEIAKIREHCVAYIKDIGIPSSQEDLAELYRRVRFLNARAGLGHCTTIAPLASALEAVLFEIVFKASHATPSALNTVAQAVDCLGRLFQDGETSSHETNLKPKVLIVDDDGVCNYMTVAALKRANFDAVCAQDPKLALQLLQAGRFDLVLLDINMPGMNGFEVCESLRRLPGYETVPVIFVTIQNDFQSRARSVVSGGDDFITKPISPLELVLKTTMHLLKAKEHRDSTLRAGSVAPPKEPPAGQPSEATQPTVATEATGTAEDQSPNKDKASPSLPTVPSTAEMCPNDDSVDRSQPVSLPETTKSQSGDTETTSPTNHTGATAELHATATAISAPAESAAAAAQNPPKHDPTESPWPQEAAQSVMQAPAEVIVTKGRHYGFGTAKTGDALRTDSSPRNDSLYVLMKTQNGNNQPFDQIALEVARLMFGDDHLTDLNLRLAGIALEHHNVPEIISRLTVANAGGNGSEAAHNESFDQLALEVVRLMFGDDHLTDLNRRLVGIALEHLNVREICKSAREREQAVQPEAFRCNLPVQTDLTVHAPGGQEEEADNAISAPTQESGAAG